MKRHNLQDHLLMAAETEGLLRMLGIRDVEQLRGQDAKNLYEKLCRKTEQCHDPKIIETFEKVIAEASKRRVKKPRALI